MYTNKNKTKIQFVNKICNDIKKYGLQKNMALWLTQALQR